MAQDPLKPKDYGKVKLPKIDNAMIKLPPVKRKGGKGAKDEDEETTLGETRDKADDAKILERGRKRLERAITAESDNRKEALEDLKFKAGDQWPADVIATRNADKRPCITVNKLPTFTRQITNDLRANRPTIHVSPVGDKGDVEVAKFYRGLIRFIERDSFADVAYDTAAQNAVDNGFGYFRILTEYESATSFNQVIRVKRIRNPFTIYLDPDHQEPDGSDSKWGFETEMIPREEFKEQYPDFDPMNWTQAGIGETMKNWVTQDSVRIANYFEVDHKSRTLVQLSNGFVGWEDEISDDVKKKIESGGLEVVDEREAEEQHITHYKMTALEILEENEWAGKWIPIVKVIGDELDIEGKVKYSGVIRHAKGAQRMYNYSATAEVELVALAPKAPFIGAEGQFEGHPEWATANTRSHPYLEYVMVDLKGTPAPPPQRQPMVTAPQGWEVIKQGAAQDMMATTGIRFDATLSERMHDESGKAIKELRRSGDLTNSHYGDNLSRSLRHAGNIYIDLIPKVYDTSRILTILREDDKEEQVKIDPNANKPYQEVKPSPTQQQPNPKIQKIFNPTYGRYGVTVTIGPSYATKRIEAAESMMDFAKAMPNAAQLIMDLIAKNMDWEGSEEIARRLAKAIPAQLLTPDQKDVPPQVQAIMQAMDAQIKQLAQERVMLVQALNEKTSDRAIAQDKINKDFEAKLLIIVQKAEAAFNKEVGQGALKLAESVNALMQSLQPKGPDPAVTAMSEAHKDLSGRLDQVIQHIAAPKGPDPGIAAMAENLNAVMKQLGKPKRAKMKRNSDGTMEVITDYGEADK